MIEVTETTIKPKTLQEALKCLQESERRITVTDAAKLVGWAGEAGRMKMSRYLQSWSEKGEFQLFDCPDGKKLIRPNIAVRPVSTPVQALSWLRTRVCVNQTNLLALIATVLACALLWYGAKLNAIYGETLGSNEESKEIFAAISRLADFVAFFAPSFGACLQAGGKKFEANGAWAALLIATLWTLNAAFGFASVNLSDTSAARTSQAQTRQELDGRIKELEKSDAELRKPSKYQSGAKGDILKLAGVQSDLMAARKERDALPAVSGSDPQAEKAQKLFGINPAWTEMAKIIAITLLPQLSGLVLMLATGLWRIKENQPEPAKIKAAKPKKKGRIVAAQKLV